MATHERRPPAGNRERLTRRRILEAALALVDREGAQALTMRRLAGDLGVATMSLYNHVSGRQELLDGLSEVMVARIGVRLGEAPRHALSRFAHDIRSVALAHPEAFRLVGMRPLHTREAFVPVEAALGALRAMGLPDDEAVHAYRALVSFARGFALGEIASFTLEASAKGGAVEPGELSAASFPHLAELAAPLADPDRDAAFAFGVEALLAGLEARLAARSG